MTKDLPKNSQLSFQTVSIVRDTMMGCGGLIKTIRWSTTCLC